MGMRGVVFTGDVEVTDELELRGPGPGEVRVRIVAAGVCHSDLSVVNGTIPFPTPVVLGHEGAGIVEEVGPGVSRLAPGDRVVLVTLGSCGACSACDRGRPTECTATLGRLEQPFTFRGAPAYAFANTSVFAESTIVRESQAVRIDDRVPMEAACLIGCGVLTGVGAVLNRAQVQPAESVAVIGIGGIGLNVIQGAVIAGATRIIAIDNNPSKEALARQFGATDFVDSGAVDVLGAMKDLVPGGVDHSFECVGHPALIRQAIDMLGLGGQCIILGVPAATAEASFVVSGLYVNKSILGCRYGTSRPHHDVPMLVELYLAGRLKLDELVSRTYPLEAVTTVFDDMHAGTIARGVLTF